MREQGAAQCVCAQAPESLCAGMQVYYNNVLSLPLIGVLMWWYGELASLKSEDALHNPMFLIAACASALVNHYTCPAQICQRVFAKDS